VTEVTGCGDLSARTDCSCNVYAQGGHLLCHDDVIANRRVSYIVYLNDPDEPWTQQDGGALELYPLAEGAGAVGVCVGDLGCRCARPTPGMAPKRSASASP
jgi:Rps23 Pro-64 3,4-dihydroxylase Tpa1-like proline 4-hydroxylase